MTDLEVKTHYADLKKEAIAFGEYLVKNYTINEWYKPSDGYSYRWYFEETDEEYTTEELYQEFIKSRQV